MIATGRWSPRALGILTWMLAATVCPLVAESGGTGNSGSTSSSAPAFTVVTRSEEELLLYELRLNGRSLTDSLRAYPLPGGIVVPLKEVARLLELPIEVEPRLGRASSSRPGAGRPSFSLDVGRGLAWVGGKEVPVPRSEIEVHQDDIFVDTRLLEQWFSITFKRDDRNARLELESRTPFPVEERWARESRAARPLNRDAEIYKDFVRLEDPYRLLDVPWVDQTVQLQYRSRHSDGEQSIVPLSQTFLAGDLLWMSAQGYANLQDPGGLNDYRLTLGRTDPEGNLLGPLHAKQFAFGDTYVPGVGLASATGVGSGFFLTNFPVGYGASQELRSFVGDLPLGWQVELYQNGNLLAFQTARADGRYEFLDVPVNFGPNDFRLIFYGPGGERREEVIRANLLDQRTPGGEFRYRFSGVDSKYGTLRGSAEFEYGAGKHLVLLASAQSLDLVGIDRTSVISGTGRYTHDYLQAGFKGYWDQAIGRLLFAQDSRTLGNAVEAGITTGLGGQVLSLSHSELRDYASEIFLPQFGAINSRSQLDLYGSLPDLNRPWGSYQFTVKHDALEKGGAYDVLMNRISVSVGSVSFSNGLQWYRFHTVPSQSSDEWFGNFLASRNFGLWSLRGQADYSLSNGSKVNSVAAYADTFVFSPLTLQAGVVRSMAQQDTSFLVNLYKAGGKVSYGANLSYSKASGVTAMFTVHVGLSRDPVNRHWNLRGDGVTGNAGLAGLLFQDANGNGRRDPGEPMIQATGLTVNGISLPMGDQDFFTDRLPVDQDSYVKVQPGSLEDPFAQPSVPGYKILGRRGHVARVELPVVNLGEVIGTVFIEEDGRQKPMGGIQAELVDRSGHTVKAVRSAYDGLFSLDGIAPGSYQLRVSPLDLKNLDLSSDTGHDIKILSTGGSVEDMNLVVRPLRPKGP